MTHRPSLAGRVRRGRKPFSGLLHWTFGHPRVAAPGHPCARDIIYSIHVISYTALPRL